MELVDCVVFASDFDSEVALVPVTDAEVSPDLEPSVVSASEPELLSTDACSVVFFVSSEEPAEVVKPDSVTV